jgi:hypothetical protein
MFEFEFPTGTGDEKWVPAHPRVTAERREEKRRYQLRKEMRERAAALCHATNVDAAGWATPSICSSLSPETGEIPVYQETIVTFPHYVR